MKLAVEVCDCTGSCRGGADPSYRQGTEERWQRIMLPGTLQLDWELQERCCCSLQRRKKNSAFCRAL